MDQEALKELISEDRLKLKAIYNKFRAEFIGFGKRYNLDEDALADVYQEAFLALRKRAIQGKLKKVKSSMKTYLFGIGKYMIFDMLKEKKLSVAYESNLHIAGEEITEISVDQEHSLTEEQVLLRRNFKLLEENCRKVLTLFYYRGLSIKEIALEAGYKDENVVKATKSRCLKMLREKITG